MGWIALIIIFIMIVIDDVAKKYFDYKLNLKKENDDNNKED